MCHKRTSVKFGARLSGCFSAIRQKIQFSSAIYVWHFKCNFLSPTSEAFICTAYIYGIKLIFGSELEMHLSKAESYFNLKVNISSCFFFGGGGLIAHASLSTSEHGLRPCSELWVYEWNLKKFFKNSWKSSFFNILVKIKTPRGLFRGLQIWK